MVACRNLSSWLPQDTQESLNSSGESLTLYGFVAEFEKSESEILQWDLLCRYTIQNDRPLTTDVSFIQSEDFLACIDSQPTYLQGALRELQDYVAQINTNGDSKVTYTEYAAASDEVHPSYLSAAYLRLAQTISYTLKDLPDEINPFDWNNEKSRRLAIIWNTYEVNWKHSWDKQNVLGYAREIMGISFESTEERDALIKRLEAGNPNPTEIPGVIALLSFDQENHQDLILPKYPFTLEDFTKRVSAFADSRNEALLGDTRLLSTATPWFFPEDLAGSYDFDSNYLQEQMRNLIELGEDGEYTPARLLNSGIGFTEEFERKYPGQISPSFTTSRLTSVTLDEMVLFNQWGRETDVEPNWRYSSPILATMASTTGAIFIAVDHFYSDVAKPPKIVQALKHPLASLGTFLRKPIRNIFGLIFPHRDVTFPQWIGNQILRYRLNKLKNNPACAQKITNPDQTIKDYRVWQDQQIRNGAWPKRALLRLTESKLGLLGRFATFIGLNVSIYNTLTNMGHKPNTAEMVAIPFGIELFLSALNSVYYVGRGTRLDDYLSQTGVCDDGDGTKKAQATEPATVPTPDEVAETEPSSATASSAIAFTSSLGASGGFATNIGLGTWNILTHAANYAEAFMAREVPVFSSPVATNENVTCYYSDTVPMNEFLPANLSQGIGRAISTIKTGSPRLAQYRPVVGITTLVSYLGLEVYMARSGMTVEEKSETMGTISTFTLPTLGLYELAAGGLAGLGAFGVSLGGGIVTGTGTYLALDNIPYVKDALNTDQKRIVSAVAGFAGSAITYSKVASYFGIGAQAAGAGATTTTTGTGIVTALVSSASTVGATLVAWGEGIAACAATPITLGVTGVAVGVSLPASSYMLATTSDNEFSQMRQDKTALSQVLDWNEWNYLDYFNYQRWFGTKFNLIDTNTW